MTIQITQNQLKSSVEGILEELIRFREDLHRFPELSWQEFQTTEKIIEMLTKHDIHNFSRPLDTGLVVDMEFDKNAPYLLLRADIDALPIQDEKAVPYRSRNTGVCHACAHDAHTATMIGVACLVKKLDLNLPYNLRFVFQPAEETIPSGGPKMIEHGVLKNVRYAFGLHMEPRLQVGTIGLTPGWVNMQSIRIDLTLEGPGGHSARPHETADLVWIASRLIQDSYQLVYREINLLDSAVILTFTEIEAKRGFNVIPNRLTMSGTLRLTDQEKREVFFERFNKLIGYVEQETGSQIKLEINEGAPAIYNDPQLIDTLQKNMQNNFWLPVQVVDDFRTPGGDDFSHYSNRVSGAMVRFGVRSESMTYSLHEGLFDVSPKTLRIAVSFFLHQIINL